MWTGAERMWDGAERTRAREKERREVFGIEGRWHMLGSGREPAKIFRIQFSQVIL